MLILLPPSEGKFAPVRGNRLTLDELDFPGLTEARDDVLTALIELCSGADTDRAAETLGLGTTQHDLVKSNACLLTAPTARADRIYTGVLYDALDVASLSPAAKRRARWLAVQSSLFGLVRLNDHIPSYRLAGDATLPGLGKVAAHWRKHLDGTVREAVGNGLIVDLRSSTYAAFWRPAADLAPQVATVRVLHEIDGRRKVVSHFNKATKGRLVRALLEDGSTPRTPAALGALLESLGWQVEVGGSGRAGTQLDVIVAEL